MTRNADHLVRAFGSDIWHAAAHSTRRFDTAGVHRLHILGCNGRAVEGITSTLEEISGQPVTCRSCLKAIASGRVEVTA